MDKEKNILEIKNINKTFGKEVQTQVLFDLNLQIKKGEFMSLIGPSGSGKSTFLNILGALERPTSGEIIFEGKEISSLNDNELAKFRNLYLGFIFQFHYLFPEFTALENVLLPYLISNPVK